MDSRLNPYAPGAGTPPPELAGRDEIIERAAVALDRGFHRPNPVVLNVARSRRAESGPHPKGRDGSGKRRPFECMSADSAA